MLAVASGVQVLDRYTYRIRVEKKYPQFQFWLAMNFFSPMPWEAERFYLQPGLDVLVQRNSEAGRLRFTTSNAEAARSYSPRQR